MSAVSVLPAEISAWLAEQESLEGIGFLTEFPAADKAVPLRRALVAVGMDSVKITDKFAENDDGVLERQEYCRSAELRLRFSVHVPFADGGERCHDIFTKVLDLLTFASDANVVRSGCGEIRAQRDTDAFVLEAWAEILADFCPAESTGLPLASFLSKELLCGSHIGDEQIHLTARDRTWVDTPFRSGIAYVPVNGGPTSVNLEQRPRAVFVFVPDGPLALIDFTNRKAASWFGCAVMGPDPQNGEGSVSHGTLGVEITAAGFRVRSASMGAGYENGLTSNTVTYYVWLAMM
ncbi:MAG: hypothetical protein LBJ11_00340 [Oscillospiraceae bacterium]|nr:hypothetical protein [Oscillospiraceae bacterium]